MNPKGNSQNLKPMKKGETRNPNGRPKGSKSMKTILKELLEIQLKDPKLIKAFAKQFPDLIKEDGKVAPKELIMIRLMGKAITGDLYAIREILDRTEGKVKDVLDTNLKSDQPINLTYNIIDADNQSTE